VKTVAFVICAALWVMLALVFGALIVTCGGYWLCCGTVRWGQAFFGIVVLIGMAIISSAYLSKK
jgi:hypothetical protein